MNRFLLIAIAFIGVTTANPFISPQAFGELEALRTEHFVIQTDVEREKRQYYARLCEGFYGYIAANFFVPELRGPLTVYVFRNAAGYERFRAQTEKSPETPYGFYDSQQYFVAISTETGIGTTLHELAHPMLEGFLKRHVPWINEGFPMFFEKTLGYINAQGVLRASFGYFSPWRFRETKKVIEQIHFPEYLRDFDRESDQGKFKSAGRSLALFLHKRGLLKRYLYALRDDPSDQYGDQTLERVFRLPLNEIETHWKRWFLASQQDPDVDLVQESIIFNSAADWEQWLRSQQPPLVWNEGEAIYKIRENNRSQ